MAFCIAALTFVPILTTVNAGDLGTPYYEMQYIDVMIPGFPGNPQFTSPQAINDGGTIVGFNQFSYNSDVPLLIDAQGVHQLVLSNPIFGRAVELNNSNVAVGWRWGQHNPTGQPNSGQPDAVRWTSPDEAGELLSGLGEESQAWDISDAGVIVGWSDDNPGGVGMRGFRWENGEATLLGTLGGATSQAFAINSSGQITGTAQTANGQMHVFLWENGVMTDLGDFSEVGGQGGVGRDISDNGVIVGTMFTANGERAFRWENGVVENLGLIASSPFLDRSEALAVSESGDIIGRCWDSGDPASALYGAGHAFLWRGGVLYDLVTHVINGDTNLELWSARDLNASGEVIGLASYGGDLRGYLNTPVVADFEYTLTVLPDPPGNVYTVVPRGLNNHGEAVGWAHISFGTPAYQGWKWTADGGTVLLPPTGLGSYGCFDINDAGQIAGDSIVVTAEDAWRYQNGSYTIIPLAPQNTWAVVTGMNQAGDLVGHSAGYNLNVPAYRYLYSDQTGLLTLPSAFGTPGRINDLQQVVGGNGDAQLWSLQGGLVTLGDPPGFSCSYATALNNTGLIAGRAHEYCNPNSPVERIAWAYARGQFQIIANIAGPGYGSNPRNEVPMAISDSGSVVGYSDVALEGDTPWIWSADKGLRLLNDVTDTTGLPTWFKLYRAVDINESGQIVATGPSLVPGNLNAAYLLTPVGLSVPGDINGDGVVDEDDQVLFCAAIGSSQGEPNYDADADLNGDDVIDHLDQQAFNDLLPPCAGDVVSSATFQPPPDGVADGADLAYVLGAWGNEPSCADMVTSKSFAPPPDGVVDAADLAYLLGSWGKCG